MRRLHTNTRGGGLTKAGYSVIDFLFLHYKLNVGYEIMNSLFMMLITSLMLILLYLFILEIVDYILISNLYSITPTNLLDNHS